MNEAKRILILNHTGVIGGAELSLYEFIREALRQPTGYRFYLGCPPGAELAARLKHSGVTLVDLPLFRPTRTKNPFLLLGYLAALLRVGLGLIRVIHSERIDLLHANNSATCLQALLAAKLCRVPLVWHVRDHVPRGPVGWLLGACAGRIITISNAVRRGIRPRHDGKAMTVYNPVTLGARGGPAGGPSARGADLIMVAQFAPWKKHEVMIDVVERLKAEWPGVRLLCVGATYDRKARAHLRGLKRKVRAAGLQDHVAFAPFRENIFELIRASRVLVHPAVDEPMGRVIAEAMLLKTPVVAANSGGVAEIIEDGVDGLLVEPGDVQAYAHAIRRVMSPDVGGAVTENGHRKATLMFDATRQCRNVLEVYGALLAGGQPS